jgi:hypothetical protein
MSALTKAKHNNRVRFRDSAGHLVEGTPAYFYSDHMLVTVRNTTKPFTWGRVGNGMKEGWVPNNSMWAVPYSDVTETIHQ